MAHPRLSIPLLAAALLLLAAGCDAGAGVVGAETEPESADVRGCLEGLELGLIVEETTPDPAAEGEEPGDEELEWGLTASAFVPEAPEANIFAAGLVAASDEDIERVTEGLDQLEGQISSAEDGAEVTVDRGGEGRYRWLVASGPAAVAEDVTRIRGCVED